MPKRKAGHDSQTLAPSASGRLRTARRREGSLRPPAARHVPHRQQDRMRSGVHPTVIKIALGAALWFIAVVWLAFAWGLEVDFSLVVVTGFFALFLTLMLITSSYAIADARWRQQRVSFAEFLRHEIDIGDGRMSGRDVLIGIALMPVVLALGGTLIGLVWLLLH